MDPMKRKELRQQLVGALSTTDTVPTDEFTAAIGVPPTEAWNSLSSSILAAATTALGYTQKHQQDWFGNSPEIHHLLQQKNAAHNSAINNPSSSIMSARFAELRSVVRSRLQQMESDWWANKAREVQGLADSHDLHGCYDAVRSSHDGPNTSASSSTMSIMPILR